MLENNWITLSELPATLCARYKQTSIRLPNTITLVGFDDFNPSYQALLTQLGAQTAVDIFEAKQTEVHPRQVMLADRTAELITMARWAKSLWEKNPKTRIACVDPDLGNNRTEVTHAFTQVFCVERMLPGATSDHPPFNLSAGLSLDQHEMIKIGLTLLHWSHQALPAHELNHLLQSPYLCLTDQDANMGAQMDALLREQNLMHVTVPDLYTVIQSLQKIYPKSSWLMRWRAFIQLQTDHENIDLPSDWVQHFIAILKILHWPGQQTQHSAAFQVLERFKKLLLSFSQLDLIYRTMSQQEALKLLNTLARQTIFQAVSHEEPVQIMGVLEASGIQFDHVWVMGLHDGIWPPPPQPNPFIPYPLQQKYQMPHANAKRELQFCEQITKRLSQCAKQVIFSTPQKLGDQTLHPSRLLQNIPSIDPSTLPLSENTTYLDHIFRSRKIEVQTDNEAPIVTDTSLLRGGASILKHQAECPFRAYAAIRLKARALNHPAIGLDAATRGSLLHQVLYRAWNGLSDHAALMQMDENKLQIIIRDAVTETLENDVTAVGKKQNRYFLAIEKKRLQILTTKWFEFEKERPPFKVVERETATQITVNKLPLKCRIDRIDELTDGTYLLIDYKTGYSSTNTWFQARLTDPQLPLYAAFSDYNQKTLSGITYAEVRSSKMSFKGVISEDHLYIDKDFSGLTPIKKIKNKIDTYQWKQLITHWQKSLTQLADDFCDGIATVDPAQKQICQYCDLKPLCRYHI